MIMLRASHHIPPAAPGTQSSPRAAENDVTLLFTHVPGEDMVLPDALSRAHFDPALKAKADRIIADPNMSIVAVRRAAFDYASFM